MWLPVGDPALHTGVVRTDPRAVVMSAGHPLADRNTLTFADLSDEPVLRPDVLVSPEAERFWLADPRPDGRPDAPPFDLAVVWTDRAPQPLITRLIAEVRAVVGDEGRPRTVAKDPAGTGDSSGNPGTR